VADYLAVLNSVPLPFARLLGIRLLSAAPDRVQAEMTIREELGTQADMAHGGSLMAFADTLGAWATMLNLPAGAGTTTLESKTNFFAPAPVGVKVLGDCSPLHRGRRTMVWQTRITSEKGRLLALVTQTQMVLEERASAPPRAVDDPAQQR
jgi:1,4-dihydroxy-2-naphthoyl-CoA hydrolase